MMTDSFVAEYIINAGPTSCTVVDPVSDWKGVDETVRVVEPGGVMRLFAQSVRQSKSDSKMG